MKNVHSTSTIPHRITPERPVFMATLRTFDWTSLLGEAFMQKLLRMEDDRTLSLNLHAHMIKAMLSEAYNAGYYAPTDSYREALAIAMAPSVTDPATRKR
jgi:hypothetical protein